MVEQERYIKVDFCRSRLDAAANHEKSRSASARHLPRLPALSVPDVTASHGAGELRSRRATEIYVLTAYAPSGRQACSAEVLVRLMSPRACRCTSLEAPDGYGQAACSAARACLVDRAAQSTLAVHDRVPYY